MKKLVALILALIMICPIVAVTASAEGEAAQPVEINIEDMPGYRPFYAGGEAIATAPIQDGIINDGEYSASRKLAPMTANKLDFVDLNNYTNFTTEYVAYDADYIYYAYENDSIWQAGAQIKIRLEHDYIIGETLTPFACHRQLQDPAAQMITVGLEGFYADAAPAGKTAPTTDDIVTGHTWDGSYAHAAVEIKISRAYLATQMGLDSAADVTKLTYSTYGQDTKWDGFDWTYLHLDHLLTEDQKAWLTEQGVKTSFEVDTAATGVTRLCNMIVLDEAPHVEMNLEDWYGATYVGAALGADDAKPVQDGVVNLGEYQAEYIVERGDMENIPTDTSRWGAQVPLLSDYCQYVAHDAENIYVAFAFNTGTSNTRGRLYWNLLFVDSFDVTYYGGNTVKDAFKQGEYALNDGWFFGAEIKEDANEDGSYNFSNRTDVDGVVDRGTVPVKGTDYDLTVNKITDICTAGTNRQVYEFKISKAWYAAQVGLESAADVRELAWTVLGGDINIGASSYTQIGHYITDADLEMLAATGLTYTRPTGSPFNNYPKIYDDASLPLLFVLDVDPDAEGEQARVPAEKAEPFWAGSIWDNGVVTTEPTHLTFGEKLYTCTKCGETKTESIAKLTEHTFGEWIQYTSTEHKHICACGEVEYSAHAWDNGVVTTEPTHLTFGEKFYTCTVCGETKTESIAKLTEHTFGEWIQYTSTEHKHICACGEVEYSAHAWDNGVVTTPATHLTFGEKLYTCTDCGATYTEQVPKLTEHEYSRWSQYNATQHIEICACGETRYTDHRWGDVISIPATPSAQGANIYTCADCGENKIEIVPALGATDDTVTDATETDDSAAESTTDSSTTSASTTSDSTASASTTNIATAAYSTVIMTATDYGCSGSILGGGAAVACATLALGAAFVTRRKKDE